MTAEDGEREAHKKYIKSCFDLIRMENLEKLDHVIDYTNEETLSRSQKLLKIYGMEWEVIGEMKKNLEKLVDNCRICEKKVKAHELIKHSKFCEKRFRIKDEIKTLGQALIDKVERFKEEVDEELQQEEQVNIGSM